VPLQLILVLLLSFVLVVVSVSLVVANGNQDQKAAATTYKIPGAPAPFDGSKGRQLHIVHISYLQEGEFMQMYRAGVEQQAAAFGMKVTL